MTEISNTTLVSPETQLHDLIILYYVFHTILFVIMVGLLATIMLFTRVTVLKISKMALDVECLIKMTTSYRPSTEHYSLDMSPMDLISSNRNHINSRDEVTSRSRPLPRERLSLRGSPPSYIDTITPRRNRRT